MTRNRMLPGFTGGKIVWLREQEPGPLRGDGPAAQRQGLHPPADDRRVRDRRLRRVGHGPSRTSSTTWSTELLGKIGVEETLLPDVVESRPSRPVP